MFGTLLHRMILAELFKVFMLALFAITGLLLLAGLVAEAQQHGLEPSQILAIIPLIIPSTLPYTLPATTLFATCVVYGRLAADSEILAIKASGVNIMRVVSPALFLGLSLSVATGALYYWLIPYTQNLLKTTVVKNIEEYMYGMLKKKGKIELPNFDYVMHVKDVDGRKLLDVTFMRKDKSGKMPFDVIANAEEGELHVDLKNKQIVLTMWRCDIRSGDGKDKAYAGEKSWPIDLPPDFLENKPHIMQMTWQELLAHFDKLHKDQAEVAQKIDRANRDIKQLRKMKKDEAGTQHYLKNLHIEADHITYQIHTTEAELHKRPALSLGCLCFVLVGCPVGIWFSRSDYLSAFVTCFMPIVFVYYPFTLCGVNMANTGKVPAFIAIWFADAILGVAAMLLFSKLLKN